MITRRTALVLPAAAVAAYGLRSTTARGAADPAQALAVLSREAQSRGPNGEAPSPAGGVSLTPDEIAKVKNMKARAAIVMHYSGNDWSQAQIAGLRSELGNLGVEVITVTDAGFKPEKQVSDIETVLAQKPNVIVSIPTDPTSTANAYKSAASKGVKLVFMDNVPTGMKPGQDYVSVVSADNSGNGEASALLMAQALKQKGQIGLVYHAADFFVTRQRYDAFKRTVAGYPDIKILAEQGIGGPDFAGDAERAASAMLTAHPRLNAIWAVWDVPAEGVISAARTAGRDESFVITTCDLGQNVAIDMAQGGFVKGLGAQRPFDQGVTEARLTAYGLLGKEAPAYVALPALPVTKSNLLEAWKQVYHTDAPKDVKSSM